MNQASSYGGHVRANQIRQHYIYYPGNGPDLVIVPGIVSPAALWQHVGEFLAPHFAVSILDVRGRGLSEQGPDLDYGIDACAADLKEFLKLRGMTSPVVIGHSMGARIAARAGALGVSLGSLIMLDPPSSAPGRRPYPIAMQRTVDMVLAARRGVGEAYLRQPGIAQWPENLLRQRAEWLATCDPRVIEAAYRDFHSQDIYADVAALSCPTTLVVAQASGVVLEDDIAAFQSAQPRLRTVRLSGAAHQLQAENTELLFAAFKNILDF